MVTAAATANAPGGWARATAAASGRARYSARCAHASATEAGLWLRDPDGTAVQLLDEPQAPPRPAAEVLVNMGGTRQRSGIAQWTQATGDVLPRRLGHSLLFTAQPGRMTDFYTQVLGLRVSDTIHHDLVTFLNAGPGDHHIFGFISSTHRGFHHASFEVPSIDAIAVGADRMRAQGRQAGWGLGRHTIGSNFFHYNPDPWGSWIEWFSDIDQIDVEYHRKDGKSVTVPNCDVLVFDGDLVRDWQIYIDLAPVFA